MMHRVGAGLRCGVAVIVLSSGVLAGPLAPPAGPVAPTPGPEPRIAINAANTPGDATAMFIISQPGSYYLEGSVTGAVGTRGVDVRASNVTIDLMGFALGGVPGSSHGVFVDLFAGHVGLELRNGVIHNWGGRRREHPDQLRAHQPARE